MMKAIILSMIIVINLFGASVIELSDINPILDNTKLFEGKLENLTVCPSNDNLITFDVNNEKENYIVLYNISNNNYLEIKSTAIDSGVKRSKYRDYTTGVHWMEGEAFFTFYGAGNDGNYNIYFCHVVDDQLRTKFSTKYYKFEIDNKNYQYLHPSFSKDGSKLLCTIKKTDEDSDIGYVNDFYSMFIKKSFKAAKIEELASKPFDQMKPIFGKSGEKEYVAYVSYTKERFQKLKRNTLTLYAEYQIILMDINSKEEYIVDNLTGYQDYGFYFGKNGRFFYYFKAIDKDKTPKELQSSNLNVINLHGISMLDIQDDNKIVKLSGNEGNILLKDVSPKYIVSLSEYEFLVATFEPANSIRFYSMYDFLTKNYNRGTLLSTGTDCDFPVMNSNGTLKFIGFRFDKYRDIHTIYNSKFTYRSDVAAQNAYEAEVNKIMAGIQAAKKRRELLAKTITDKEALVRDNRNRLIEIENDIVLSTNESTAYKAQLLTLENLLITRSEDLSREENSYKSLQNDALVFYEEREREKRELQEETKRLSKLKAEVDYELIIFRDRLTEIDRELEGLFIDMESQRIVSSDYEKELNLKFTNLEEENEYLNELQDLKFETEKKAFKAVQEEIDKRTDSIEKLKDEIRYFDRDITSLEKNIADYNEDIVAYNQEINDKKVSIELVKATIKDYEGRKEEWLISKKEEEKAANKIRLLELDMKSYESNLLFIDQQIQMETNFQNMNVQSLSNLETQLQIKTDILNAEINNLNDIKSKK